MNKVVHEFVSDEQRPYRVKFGRLIASSLAGFVAGVIFASIIWGLIIYFMQVSA